MTFRQPTVKQARRIIARYLECVENDFEREGYITINAFRCGNKFIRESQIGYVAGGFSISRLASYRVRKVQTWESFEEIGFPFSDISLKCHDCGCVIRDRRDGQGQFIPDASNTNQMKGSRGPSRFTNCEWINVCLSCFNKRRPIIKALTEFNENRLVCVRIEKEIRNAKNNYRDDRGLAGISDEHDAGSSEWRHNDREGVNNRQGCAAG